MSSLRRILVIFLLSIALFVMSASFTSNDILDRAIIIGLGLDLSQDNELVVTAEVVSPGNGSEQVGTFSKTITVQGQTVAHAIGQITQKMGKEASLGQCALLILGNSLYTRVDFSQIIDFFIHSYNFKESSVICCAKGEAKQILNYGEGTSQSVSLAIVSMLQQQAKSTALPTNSLLQYARSQKELSRTGFINHVQFVPSQNVDEQNPNKIQGYFSYDQLVVFRNNKFVGYLSNEQLRGLSLLTKSVTGDVFIVQADGEKVTFITGEKSVDFQIDDTNVTLKIKLKCRLARSDDFGVNGVFTVQTEQDLPKELLQNIQRQATDLVQNFVDYQRRNNVDLIYLHEKFRQKQGSTDFVNTFSMDDLHFDVQVRVEQN